MEFSNELFTVDLPTWFLVSGGFMMAFFITYVSIPPIVKLAYAKGLFDLPNGRTSHTKATPCLGGIAVFTGLIISTIVMAGIGFTKEHAYIIAGLTMLLFIGLKDDIVSLAPFKKLVGQLIAVGIIVLLGDIRIDNFYGCLGLEGIPYIPSALFSMFVFIVIINGINLIDGIDGLASAISILISVTLGIWFLSGGFILYAIISFSLIGSLMAFFYFNVFSKKYKIFLGDSGSLIVGLTVAVMIIRFIGYQTVAPDHIVLRSAPAIAFGILIVPFFDTIRVFILRISQGRSPLSADRQHVHHILLDFGHSHLQATLILVMINFLVVLLSLGLQNINTLYLIFLQLGLSTVITLIAVILLNRRRKKAFQKHHFMDKRLKALISKA
jgi:UDP-GlcNAc:undecaprenyl-phosphate GlcNAc-1-phosphate transferase